MPPFSWVFQGLPDKEFDWQFVLVAQIPCGRSPDCQKKPTCIDLILDLLILAFLGRGEFAVCHFRIWLFVSGSYSKIHDSSPVITRLKNSGSLSRRSKRSRHTFLRLAFCSVLRIFGTILAQTFLMTKFCVKIWWTANRFKFNSLLIILNSLSNCNKVKTRTESTTGINLTAMWRRKQKHCRFVHSVASIITFLPNHIYIYIYIPFHTHVSVRVFNITWNIFHPELLSWFWTSILCLNNSRSVDVGYRYKTTEYKGLVILVVILQCRVLWIKIKVWCNNPTGQEGYGNKRVCYILNLILICCIHVCNKEFHGVIY